MANEFLKMLLYGASEGFLKQDKGGKSIFSQHKQVYNLQEAKKLLIPIKLIYTRPSSNIPSTKHLQHSFAF